MELIDIGFSAEENAAMHETPKIHGIKIAVPIKHLRLSGAYRLKPFTASVALPRLSRDLPRRSDKRRQHRNKTTVFADTAV